MTAKEKVLSVYPDAVCKRRYGYNKDGIKTKQYVFAIFEDKHQLKYLSTAWYRTPKLAFEDALNELIKQGLCTE
jgi:hypothetical protein